MIEKIHKVIPSIWVKSHDWKRYTQNFDIKSRLEKMHNEFGYKDSIGKGTSRFWVKSDGL